MQPVVVDIANSCGYCIDNMLHQRLLLTIGGCVVLLLGASEVAAAFTMYAGRKTHNNMKDTYQLKANSNPLLELVKVVAGNDDDHKGDIDSVYDFDASLASEIQDALMSAGIEGIDNDGVAMMMEDTGGKINKQTNNFEPRPPSYPPNKPHQYTSSELLLPPHTALASVLANQYNIDLNSITITPSAKKITAEDVEYHIWKLAQPPCSAEVLELAHSRGIDLNELYDDEDRETELDMSDVQLFIQHERSLKLSSQKIMKNGRIVKVDNDTLSSKKKMKKMSDLDKRVEANMDKLSDKAMKLFGSVSDEIVQQVKLQTGINSNGNAVQHEFSAVKDFDIDLASEIEEALSIASNIDGEVGISAVCGEDTRTIEPSQEERLQVGEQEIESSDAATTKFSEDELQSMTCVQLKELLREQGMRVSGRKAELIDRLLDGYCDVAQEDDDRGDDNTPPLFFATLQ